MIHYQDDRVTVHHANCLDILRDMPDCTVDAVITDPPYGLSNTDPKHVVETITRWVTGDRDYTPEARGFMGHAWDAFVPPPAVWDECLRVLKPGGHALVFSSSRTTDLMTLSLRMAGFEIRDSIAWLYGGAMPKSLDVGKAIDKRGGNAGLADQIAMAIRSARERRGWTTGRADRHFCGGSTNWTWFEGRKGVCRPPTPETFARIVAEWPELAPWADAVAEAAREFLGMSAHRSGIGNGTAGHYTVGGTRAEHVAITAPATDAAKRWEGWGTGLRPSMELVCVARKPIPTTVAACVQEWGTGALNIDATRIASEPWTRDNKRGSYESETTWTHSVNPSPAIPRTSHTAGRWPANVVLDDVAAAQLDHETGPLHTQDPATRHRRRPGWTPAGTDREVIDRKEGNVGGLDEKGMGASRFFPVFKYQAKAPQKERPSYTDTDGKKVSHSTVKPVTLMRWLVRLVTPPDGLILEPFAGSGTTIEAAILEGFRVVGVEQDAPYLPLITIRVERAHTQRQPASDGLFDDKTPVKKGRWPANVVMDKDAAAQLDHETGDRRSAGMYPTAYSDTGGYGGGLGLHRQGPLYDDAGGPSRFFGVFDTEDQTVPPPHEMDHVADSGPIPLFDLDDDMGAGQ